MSLSVGIVGLPNAGPRELTFSRGLHPRVEGALMRGYSGIFFIRTLSRKGDLYVS